MIPPKPSERYRWRYGRETRCISPPPEMDSPTGLEVTAKTTNSLTVRWTPAPGPVSGYRISSSPQNQPGETFSEVLGPGT